MNCKRIDRHIHNRVFPSERVLVEIKFDEFVYQQESNVSIQDQSTAINIRLPSVLPSSNKYIPKMNVLFNGHLLTFKQRYDVWIQTDVKDLILHVTLH